MKVLFEKRHGTHGAQIGLVTLNSPETLNALNEGMVQALQERLQEWAADPATVCVLIRSAGERAFCAGGDIRTLARACLDHPGEVPPPAARFFEHEYRLVHTLRTFPKPVLCWGHGYVLGGGMGLFQSGGVRIVTPSSRLGMPEISIGLYPDTSASWFLPRLPGRLGLFMGLTGAQLNATDALALGMADRLLTEDQQPELIEGLLQINWQQQPEVQLNSLLRMLAEQAQAHLPAPQLLTRRQRIDQILDTADLPGGWHALVSLEQDEDAYLAQAARNLRTGAPLTAHLVWTQMQQAKHLSLAQALRMEYALSTNCCRYPEFAEGVRARLIDKDNQPHWHWPDVDSVPSAVVEAHFAPTWEGAHPLADLLDHWR